MTTVYDSRTVIIAAVLTASIVVALTLYAFNTDTDFTMMGGFLFMFTLGLIVASVIGIFWQNRYFGE